MSCACCHVSVLERLCNVYKNVAWPADGPDETVVHGDESAQEREESSDRVWTGQWLEKLEPYLWAMLVLSIFIVLS